MMPAVVPQVYALMGGFASCPVNFHALDGSGYAFIADSVIELDKLNAQVRDENENEGRRNGRSNPLLLESYAIVKGA